MSTATPTTRRRKPKTTTLAVMETVICHICGEIVSKDESVEFDGKNLCSDCVDNDTTVCDNCNVRIWSDDNAGDFDTRLCQDCCDSHYKSCGDCGVIISNDNVYHVEGHGEEPYCYYCHSQPRGDDTIRNYTYKPTPIFYGLDSNRYFGVELEIDDGGSDSNNAQHLLQIANRLSETIYIKSDGSLNNGFEIVTHPMTLDYHMNDMAWKKLAQKAVRIGYKSHETNTCGFHVHVNRTAFGDDVPQQELYISRILFLVERFWQELLVFSRRKPSQISQWAKRYGFKHEPTEILSTAKSSNRVDRHTCVNLNNEHTIEFRIFKGTLKYTTLIATLQLVNHICDIALSMSTEDITELLSWCAFVEKIDKTKHLELVMYLKERRLYINEPMETDGDM